MSAYTADQIEAVLGVKPATLRKWASRRLVDKVGRDLYDGDSVIARWRARAAEEEATRDPGR